MTKQTHPSSRGGRDNTAIAENIQYTHWDRTYNNIRDQKKSNQIKKKIIIILTGKNFVELNSWDSYLPTFLLPEETSEGFMVC